MGIYLEDLSFHCELKFTLEQKNYCEIVPTVKNLNIQTFY
jgi:hypothetical protein